MLKRRLAQYGDEVNGYSWMQNYDYKTPEKDRITIADTYMGVGDDVNIFGVWEVEKCVVKGLAVDLLSPLLVVAVCCVLMSAVCRVVMSAAL